MNRSIGRSSTFNLNAGLEESYGSYLFDKKSKKHYLDFFGMYASLPLGYNHEIFSQDSFMREVMLHAKTKVTNCEFITDETLEFDKKFQDFAGSSEYTNYHYSCTGALAIESAIKTAIIYKGHSIPKIVTFDGSFHGINSYGGFITSRFEPVIDRLDGLPEIFSAKIKPTMEEVKKSLDSSTTCVLVEPIMCSSGDNYMDIDFLKELRIITEEMDIPLIFDEIQIGFCSSGDIWYSNKIEVMPDILVFGKKVQLSGIMVKEKFSKLFERPIMLEVTWDGNPIDMIRGKYIIDACIKYDLLKNVNKQSEYFKQLLGDKAVDLNFRNSGFIMAMDFLDTNQRNKVVNYLYENQFLVNSTGKNTIRLRPPLTASTDDIEKSIEIFQKCFKELDL